MGRPIVNHLGKVFGKLTIVGNGYPLGKQRVVVVRCECGTRKDVAYGNLLSGSTISCGCYIQAIMKAQQQPTHGMTNTTEYRTWVQMKVRCYDKTATGYRYYGGRGITVCARWLNSFDNFYADMGAKPEPKRSYSIERRRNNLGYSPDNCYWATPEEQGRNKRNNRLITANGKTQTLVEWAEEMNLKESAIQERLRRGWKEEDAVLIPKLDSGIFHLR